MMEWAYWLFACLITVQFVVVVAHDWLEIPGWTHGRQVQSVAGRRKLLIATLINAIFPGTAVVFVLYYGVQPKPSLVTNYWLVYCALTLASAIFMWWIPYFRGTDSKTKQEYLDMYRGTLHVLPARGDNPRPNLLHLCFHALFVVTFGLSFLVRFSGS
jgi:hypothetical protein